MALHVEIDAAATPADRDALAAVAHAGTRVTWSGAAVPPLAAVAVRAREPGGPVRIAVASGAAVALSDGLAALDTVARRGRGTWRDRRRRRAVGRDFRALGRGARARSASRR